MSFPVCLSITAIAWWTSFSMREIRRERRRRMRRLACTCSTTAAKPLVLRGLLVVAVGRWSLEVLRLDRVRVAGGGVVGGGFVLERMLLDGRSLCTVVETATLQRRWRAVYFFGGGGVGAGEDGACGVTLGGGCVATLGAGCVSTLGDCCVSNVVDIERVWRRVSSYGSRRGA